MGKILEKPSSFLDSFDRKPAQKETTHYCPGCGHGVLNKLIAEAMQDLGIVDETIFVGPVGCGVFFYYYFGCSCISAPHGRASAVATGTSRVNPGGITISYQGDGDLAAIGTNNAIHAANRGENMIVFFVNNNIYGMTGGQLAPTSLLDQKTATSPYGRNEENDGYPLKMAEIISTLESPVLVARVAVNNPKNIRKARQIVQKGLALQKEHKGYVFIEVLSQCPTNWKKSPLEACQWIDDTVSKYYPLGVFKDQSEERDSRDRILNKPDFPEIAELLQLNKEQAELKYDGDLPFGQINLKSAGFGGQGVLSLGLIFAEFAMKKGLEVTWLPSYGPEMRGGTANCSVVVSKNEVGSPVVDRPNILIAMNKPSLFKFGPLVPEDGIIIYNQSLIDEVPELKTKNCFAIPATDMAREAGNVKVSNTIVLAALARQIGIFSYDELKELLKEYFSNEKIYQLNLKALEMGWNYELS